MEAPLAATAKGHRALTMSPLRVRIAKHSRRMEARRKGIAAENVQTPVAISAVTLWESTIDNLRFFMEVVGHGLAIRQRQHTKVRTRIRPVDLLPFHFAHFPTLRHKDFDRVVGVNTAAHLSVPVKEVDEVAIRCFLGVRLLNQIHQIVNRSSGVKVMS